MAFGVIQRGWGWVLFGVCVGGGVLSELCVGLLLASHAYK